MDERSPRQPDSSDSPDDSGESSAYDARPENPYRIPQRPSGTDPSQTGGFDGDRPYPYTSESTDTGDSPSLSSWDNPFRSPEFPEGPVEASSASGEPTGGPEDFAPASETSQTPSFDAWSSPEHDNGADDSWEGVSSLPEPDRPWHEQGIAPGPAASETESPFDAPGSASPQASRDTWGPDPYPTGEDGPSTYSGGRHTPYGDTTSPSSSEEWAAPYGDGTSQAPSGGWSTPYGNSEHTPGTSWSEPGNDPPHFTTGAGASSLPSEGWGTDSTPEDNSAAYSEGWGTPHGDTPPPASSGEWESPYANAGHAWDEPSTDTFPSEHSWGAATPTNTWDTPSGDQPHHGQEHTYSSWQEYGTGAQAGHRSWDEPRGEQPAQEWGASSSAAGGPYSDSPYPHETSVQGHEAGAESWETPYRGQPVHEGDTPYPGVVSFDRDRPDQRPGDGFEYLYSGDQAYSGSPPDHGYEPDEDDYDPGPPRKKSRKGLLIGVTSVVVVLALIGGGVFWYVRTLPQPEEATTAYASAWEAQDYEALAAVTTGNDSAETLGGIDAGLGVDGIDVSVGEPTTDGGTGSASYEVTVSLTNADDWGWEGELPLIREDGEWWVDFSPEVAYPGLGEGQVLARTAVWGERGQILAADGTRMDGPDTSGSLQMIAGSLGEADEDDVERLGPAYNVGDTIGVEGLQRTYEERLAGEAATTILMVDAEEAEDPASLEATEDNTVVSLDGSDGEDIVTSIDMGVQNAAAGAIIDSGDPAGLVAVRPSSGEILAAVNVPGGFNRSFEGQYPPGSAFKIVTYSALLDNGLPVDGTMECPEEYELGGWPFRNAGEAEYGSQSVTEAFATSCNTALVAELGDRLSGEQLQASAEQFGMNQPLDIGVTTHEPTFPPVDSATMLGAQGIGQGQILTSPLHMATVPAAVADGSWRHPMLVTEPANEELPEPAPVANAETLRSMMRAVITDGTASDVGFEGEVFGKTGTAEFGTAEDADEDDELPSHAWMVGYKGDIAFAVVVDGGGGGSSVAGPLAANFTNAL